MSTPGEPWRTSLSVREFTPDQSPELVFFSSVSENTRRFTEQLGLPAARIPCDPGWRAISASRGPSCSSYRHMAAGNDPERSRDK